jgi:hypothetical protein
MLEPGPRRPPHISITAFIKVRAAFLDLRFRHIESRIVKVLFESARKLLPC